MYFWVSGCEEVKPEVAGGSKVPGDGAEDVGVPFSHLLRVRVRTFTAYTEGAGV